MITERQLNQNFAQEIKYLLNRHQENLEAIKDPFNATQLPNAEEQAISFINAIAMALGDHRTRQEEIRLDAREHPKSERACELEIKHLQGELKLRDRILGQFHMMVDSYLHTGGSQSKVQTAEQVRAVLRGQLLWDYNHDGPAILNEGWKGKPEPAIDVADYGESEGYGESTPAAEYGKSAEARQRRLHAAAIAQEVIGKRGIENYDTHSRRFLELAQRIERWLNDGTT